MPKKKLKDVRCQEIRCKDCPIQDSMISCAHWSTYEPFEEFYLRYKDLIGLRVDDIDLEKEVEVNE